MLFSSFPTHKSSLQGGHLRFQFLYQTVCKTRFTLGTFTFGLYALLQQQRLFHAFGLVETVVLVHVAAEITLCSPLPSSKKYDTEPPNTGDTLPKLSAVGLLFMKFVTEFCCFQPTNSIKSRWLMCFKALCLERKRVEAHEG